MKRSKYQANRRALDYARSTGSMCDRPDSDSDCCVLINFLIKHANSNAFIQISEKRQNLLLGPFVSAMRIIFLAHVSSLSLGWARLADPNSEMRNQKCQKPVELNKYFDFGQGKGQDKDSRQNKGQLTGGATRPQIAINMPEIGIQKMRCEGSSCNWVQRGGQTGAIYVKIVVLKT